MYYRYTCDKDGDECVSYTSDVPDITFVRVHHAHDGNVYVYREDGKSTAIAVRIIAPFDGRGGKVS